MEFGIYLRRAKTYNNMLDLAKKAENLEFQGAYINDHVQGLGDDPRSKYLEAWTVMTGIGMATSRLRVGQIVLFNSLRNPAYLAKSIATLDIMTKGRYELMLGAGWNAAEYEGYDLMERGRGMPSAKERVDRFEEAIQIVKSMLENEETSFDGKYWKLRSAFNIPQPIQKPMRISIGCEKPRMMDITAKYASGINLGGSLSKLHERIIRFSNIVKRYDKSLGDFYVSHFTTFHITKSDEEARQIAEPIAKRTDLSREDVLNNYYIGNAENIVKKARKAKDMGIKLTIVILPHDTDDDHKSIEYFHDNVITQI